MASAPTTTRAREFRPRDFLLSLPLFEGIGDEELDRIAAGTRQLHVPRGETVFSRGDPATGFHIVLYGQVKLSITSPRGNEKVVEIIGPRMSFGEAVMFLELPYPVNATTLADSLLLHVSRAAVFEEVTRAPRFALRMLGGLSRRLHGLLADVEAYSLRSGTQRVIGFLLSQQDEQAADGGLVVTLPAGKGVIASRLNLTPEHFSRILHDLAEAGLVRVEGREVRIPDPKRLSAYE